MELFFLMFAISVPIFYLWGFFSFLGAMFGKKEAPPEIRTHFEHSLRQRARQYPELTLTEFLEEYDIGVTTSSHKTYSEAPIIQRARTLAEQNPLQAETIIQDERDEVVPSHDPIPRDELLAVMQDMVEEAEDELEPVLVDGEPEPVLLEAEPEPEFVDDEPEPVLVENEAIATIGEMASYSSEYEDVAETYYEEDIPHKKAQSQEAVFSWSNWYAENSINLLLFLGAFLIVAAVSLFVTFNWDSFGGATRFGIVVAFTIAWYIAGVGVRRFESLQTVSLTFITIGAILTPFCGLAWHYFIGSMDSLGWTWLLTSVISTLIYLSMSYIYQKSYFTYAANLGILAMMLSLVQVNAAPQEYFILAGSVTALITLAGRVLLQYQGQLEAFYGRDFEYSSMATLAFSVAAGLILVPMRGMSYFSIEVFAVTVVTAIYFWVYLFLNTNKLTVTSAHLLTTFSAVIGALVFLPDSPWVIYLPVATHILTEMFLRWRLSEEHAEIIQFTAQISLMVTILAYFAALIFYPELRMVTVVLMAIIIAQVYALVTELEQELWFFAPVLLSYAFIAHLLYFLQIEPMSWKFAFFAFAILQAFLAYAPLKTPLRFAFMHTATLALSIISIVVLAMQNAVYASDSLTLDIVISFLSLVILMLIVIVEGFSQSPLLAQDAPVALGYVGLVAYGFTWNMGLPFVSALYMLQSGILFFLAFQHNKNVVWLYVVSLSAYPLLYHVIAGFDIPLPYWSSIFAILALAQVGLGYSSFQIQVRRAYFNTGLLGLSAFSILALALPNLSVELGSRPELGLMTGLGTILTSLVVFCVILWREGRSESDLLPELAPIILSFVGLLCYGMSVPLENAFASSMIVALVGTLFFLTAYYHNMPNALYVSALSVYPFGFHLFMWTGMDLYLLPIVFTALAIAQLFLVYRPLPEQVRRICLQVSLLALVSVSIGSLALSNQAITPDYFTRIALGVAVTSLAVFSVLVWKEGRTEESLLDALAPIILSFVGLICYGMSIPLENAFGSTLLVALTGTLFFLTAYYHNMPNALYVSAISVYPFGYHLFMWTGMDLYLLPIVFTALAIAQLFLVYLPLPEQVRRICLQVSLLALATVSIGSLSLSIQATTPDYFTGIALGVAITSLAVFSVLVWKEGRTEESLLDALAPIILSFVGLICYAMSVPLENAFGSSLLVALVGILFFLTAYYHNMPNALYVTALSVYPFGFHLFMWTGMDLYLLPIVFTALAIAKLFLVYLPLPEQVRSIFLQVSLAALATVTFGSLALSTIRWAPDYFTTISVLTAYITAFAYIGFAFTESRSEIALITRDIHKMTSVVLLIAYAMLWALGMYFVSAGMMVLLGILLTLTFFNTDEKSLVYLALISIYPITINILQALNIPLENYPYTLAVISASLYVGNYILTDSFAAFRTPIRRIAMSALVLTTVLSFGYAIDTANPALHIAGWVNAYTFLVLLWLNRQWLGERHGIYIYLGLVLGMYYWHIFYLLLYVNPALFSDFQWYTAGLGLYSLFILVRELLLGTDKETTRMIQWFTAALFFVPTFYQIVILNNLAYAALGIAYSLLFVAVGIQIRQPSLQRLGSIALVATILVQSGDFLLSLPRWLIIGLVGFGLISSAVFLSVRRRGKAKDELQQKG